MKNKKALIITIVTAIALLAITIYSALVVRPHIIKVREETLISNKINDKLDGFLVAYFCDLNYGNNLKDEDIENIEKKINDFNPDLIIFGGDLISDKCADTSKLISFLDNLDAKYGKYAVLGNEDVYNQNARNILEQTNFRLLSNANEKVYVDGSFVNIVGVDPSVMGLPNVSEAYSGVNSDYYTIAITHCPDYADKLDTSSSDYILSGHSLGGPVYIPLINFFYRPSGAQNYFKGKYNVGSAILDVSTGLGTKEKDIRLFTDAEIVLYKLKAK